MELRHLRYFVAVAEYGSFSAAARRLHVAQSAISEQISDLEEEIGVPLFRRTPRRTVPTRAGTAFLKEAQQILESSDQAVEMARRAYRGQVGSLRVGFVAGSLGDDFPHLVRTFRRQFPEIQLSLHEMISIEQWEALARGTLDIGFTNRIGPEYRTELRSQVIRHDPMLAILPKGHRAAPGPVDIRDLAGERFVILPRASSPAIHDKVIELCSGAGFSPRIAIYSTRWSTALMLVQAGEGIAVMPARQQQSRPRDLVFCPLKNNDAFVEFVMAWPAKRADPIIRNFRSLAARSFAIDSAR